MKELLYIVVISVFSLVFVFGCQESPAEAKRTLGNAGYDDIEITGHRIFGCGQGDFYRTGFEATTQNGQRVSGVVCSGFFKRSTIRFD